MSKSQDKKHSRSLSKQTVTTNSNEEKRGGEPKDGDAAKWKPSNEMVTATRVLILQLLPAGSKIRGRGAEKAMMSNRNQNDKATKRAK